MFILNYRYAVSCTTGHPGIYSFLKSNSDTKYITTTLLRHTAILEHYIHFTIP